jgi:ATP-dependent DNA helicase RecG
VYDISALVAQLRATGGDTAQVEVKAAAGGLPESLTSTLSALANMPGGGLVVLGLDEATGFTPVALRDTQALKQGLASKARAYTPPVGIVIHDADVEGQPVIVAEVAECPVAMKPCVVTSSGKAYVRSYDGDFELSELEKTAFLVNRTHPAFDRELVPGSSKEDLDPKLVAAYLRTVRERDPEGLGRYDDDDELLRRAGVLVRANHERAELTVAGVLTLGQYPQQWFPRWVISAASMPGSTGSARRADSPKVISGPIPAMLSEAMKWGRSVFAEVLVTGQDGNVRSDREYPLDAFRELVSNALVHRDLADWSRGYAIELRHYPERIVLSNPGGLFGIPINRLGEAGVTSARNAQILSICQHVVLPDDETRVVEALATGIPTIAAALERHGLPPAEYLDQGIRFTAIISRRRAAAGRSISQVRGRSMRAVFANLTDQPQTVREVMQATGYRELNTRRMLNTLLRRGLVTSEQGADGLLRYRRAPE